MTTLNLGDTYFFLLAHRTLESPSRSIHGSEFARRYWYYRDTHVQA